MGISEDELRETLSSADPNVLKSVLGTSKETTNWSSSATAESDHGEDVSAHLVPTTIYAHVEVKRECAFIYAKYRLYGWAARDRRGRKRVKCKSIKLESSAISSGINTLDFEKRRRNVSRVKGLIELYNGGCPGIEVTATITLESGEKIRATTRLR